ncbi:DUF692 family protein [Kamptonema cortianum]|nr:DUF692 family protein [Geitlerinema splendidum]MDK3156299.1 DUF692 family protein [Kamptonema cortianum]
MQLAVNQSAPALQLYAQGDSPIDLIKCAWFNDWITESQAIAPSYVHFPLLTSPDGLIIDDGRPVDWNEIENSLHSTQSHHLNIHAFADPKLFDTDDSSSPRRILESTQRCVDEAHSALPETQVIVENVVSRAGGKLCHPYATNPEFFSDLVQKSECGLLLDTAHLRITCLEQGWDWIEIIESMPLHALEEWHVCGCQIPERDKVFYDSMPMTDEDWEITKHVLKLIRRNSAKVPKIVALEIGGIGGKFEWRTDYEVIRDDLNCLKTLLDSHN